jgi:hypothetical protein
MLDAPLAEVLILFQFNAPGVSLGGNPLDGTIVSPTATSTLPLVESPTRTIAVSGFVLRVGMGDIYHRA